MIDDKDLIPLDDLSDMAKWIAKHRKEEGAIVISFSNRHVAIGATGSTDKILNGLNCAIYQVMGSFTKEIEDTQYEEEK